MFNFKLLYFWYPLRYKVIQCTMTHEKALGLGCSSTLSMCQDFLKSGSLPNEQVFVDSENGTAVWKSGVPIRVSKFPRNTVPVPTPKFEFLGEFVPVIPQNIGLSPPWRFPNFPHLSTYFLIPKIQGKSGYPRYSLEIPENYIFQRKSYLAFLGNFLKINDYFWEYLATFIT